MDRTENISKKNVVILIAFMLLMVGLGISDSSRGVFSGIFEKDLLLTKPQVSMIVTVSYIGNLLFVSLGGKAADRFERKKVLLTVLVMWVLAQVLFACTNNYACLLIGMFFSMGASTLLNTLMNLLSPLFFGSMAGMFVNILFFVQGIGTSGNQKLMGSAATGYQDFQWLCIGLGVIGVVSALLLWFKKFPQEESKGSQAESHSSQKKPLSYQMVVLMGLVFGFYFIAEHGIMNWWSMYCQQGLQMSSAKASTGVALFFGTMTVGRLVLAPLVQKLGTSRSIVLLGGIGTVVYIAGVLLGESGTMILGVSGIFISIIYPTIVLFLQEVFPKENVATATGLVISFGTIFDIVFNAVFGSAVEMAGFGVCKVIFPLSMILFYVGFLVSAKKEK